MSEEPSNGNVLRHRVSQLEHRAKNIEEGTRLLSQFGERNNTQIKVLDSQVTQLHEELHDVRVAAQEVAVLRSEVNTLVEGWRAVRNAFLAAAGGLILLAVSIVWQATS